MIKIKKVKLTSMNYLEVDYEEEILQENQTKLTLKVSKSCNWDVHNDFKIQLDALKPHLNLLCELNSDELLLEADDSRLSKLKVTGYTIGGEDEHEGVVLIGRKLLTHNRVLNLVTPFAKWEDEHCGYKHSYELYSCIKRANNEAIEYLEGKKSPSTQMQLEFEKESA